MNAVVLAEQIGQRDRSVETNECGVHLLGVKPEEVQLAVEKKDRGPDPVGLLEGAASPISLGISPIRSEHPCLPGFEPSRATYGVDGVSAEDALALGHVGERQLQIVGPVEGYDCAETGRLGGAHHDRPTSETMTPESDPTGIDRTVGGGGVDNGQNPVRYANRRLTSATASAMGVFSNVSRPLVQLVEAGTLAVAIVGRGAEVVTS